MSLNYRVLSSIWRRFGLRDQLRHGRFLSTTFSKETDAGYGQSDVGQTDGSSTRKKANWNRSVNYAEKLVGYPKVFDKLKGLPGEDIFSIFSEIRKLLGTNHPLLKIAKRLIYNGRHEMYVRGLIILLISKIIGLPQKEVDSSQIVQNQQNLAEIIEMIHTARYVHKNVINIKGLVDCDDEDVKDAMYGNKVAILVGDYLLSQASGKLADLKNLKVLEYISTAIKNFAEGEFVFEQNKQGISYPKPSSSIMEWEMKTFLGTGSLLANGCRSVAVLANHNETIQSQTFEFGKNLALAIQAFKDIQMFVDDNLVPPRAYFDLCSLPFIFHIQKHPSLLESVVSQLQRLEKLDYKQLRETVRSEDGVMQAKPHALKYVQEALKGLENFPKSDERMVLEDIIHSIMQECEI